MTTNVTQISLTPDCLRINFIRINVKYLGEFMSTSVKITFSLLLN